MAKLFCNDDIGISDNTYNQIELETGYGDDYIYKYLTPDEAIEIGNYLIELANKIKERMRDGVS